MSSSDLFTMKPLTPLSRKVEVNREDLDSEPGDYLEDFEVRDEPGVEEDSDYSDLDIGNYGSGGSEGGFDELFKRQLCYPPLPRYDTPLPYTPNPLDKLGLLTPMEELTEPPSTTGTRTPNSRPMTGRASRAQSRAQSGRSHPGSARRLSNASNSNREEHVRASSSKREPVVTFNPQNDIINIPPEDFEDSKTPENQPEEESHKEPEKEESDSSNMSNSDQNSNHSGENHEEEVIPEKKGDPGQSDDILSEEAKDLKLRKERKKKGKTLEELEEQIRKIESAGRKRTEAAARSSKNSQRRAFIETPKPNAKSPKGHKRSKSDLGMIQKKFYKEEDVASASAEISSSSGGSPFSEDDHSSTFLQLNDLNEEVRQIEVTLTNNPIDSETSSDSPSVMVHDKFERIRNWQRADDEHLPVIMPKYSVGADSEFAGALDGMITQLHGTKVNWEHRVKLADELTASLKNVSPQTLLKYICQIIPLATSIASESHFRVSLSILNTIMVLGDRLRDCRIFLNGRTIANADLTWLIRRLCNICGESRSTLRTEGALALSHLIKGAGPDLICEPLYLILASPERGNKNSGLTAGPRIKGAALDALTFALLTFPRDDFDLPVLATHACKCLWNTKRRVRQGALECLAVVASYISPSVALPLFRKFIEETKDGDPSAITEIRSLPRKGKNPVANPYSAVSARVSRHLLPSPSPAGLVEYAVSIPQRGLDRDSSMDSTSTNKTIGHQLEPLLNGRNSRFGGASVHQLNNNASAADVAWILAGTGPTANTPFCSPNSQHHSPREWLSDQNLGVIPGVVLEGDPTRASGDRRLGSNPHLPDRLVGGGYIQEQLQNQMNKGSWATNGSSLNPPYATNTGGLPYSMQPPPQQQQQRFRTNGNSEGPKPGEKGFSILPNKYSSSGPQQPQSEYSLMNPLPPPSQYSSNGFGDLNSNWGLNGHKNYSSPPPLVHPNGSSKGPGGVQQYLDYHSQIQQHRNFMGDSGGLDEADSDALHTSGYTKFNPTSKDLYKYKQNYDIYGVRVEEEEEDRGDGGIDSAGSSSTTRDSGVSSLKSGKTLPSPPENDLKSPRKEISGRGSRSNSKGRSPNGNGMPLIDPPYGFGDPAHSNNWGSSPDLNPPSSEEKSTDDEVLKLHNSRRSRSNGVRNGSPGGFLHRKKVGGGPGVVRKSSSSDFLAQKMTGMKLTDVEDGEGAYGVGQSLSHSNSSLDRAGKTTLPTLNGVSRTKFPVSMSMDSIELGDDFTQDHPRPPPPQRQSQTSPSPYHGVQHPHSHPQSRASPLRTGKRTPNNNNIYLNKNTSEEDLPSPPLLPPSLNKSNGVGGKKMPAKIYKGSFMEANSRPNQNEVYPDDLKPVDNPRHALTTGISQISSKDWEPIIDGFKLLVRLMRHNPEFIRSDLHNINMLSIGHLLSLRSQVCKYACHFFRELFMRMEPKSMEPDVEKIVERLLDKTADTNKFIKEDAAATLETCVLHIPAHKLLQPLENYGAKHRNAIVRCSTAKLVGVIVRRVGAADCLYDLAEKLLPMLVRFIQEGSLETRTHAKGCFLLLMRERDFEAILKRTVDSDALRHAAKALNAIKAEIQGKPARWNPIKI